MDFTAKNLISIAANEVGYKEKASNSKLDDKTANAGNKNYTKYARDLNKAGYYNGNKNGYAWCDVFVDWCFYQLTSKDSKKAQALEYQTGPLGAGCKYSAQYYRNKGRFKKTPEAGDQIFFGKVGSEEHTGIVEKVSGSKVYTIEGNSGNKVSRHTYSINDSHIAGYGRPNYEKETVKTETPTETKTPAPETPKQPTSVSTFKPYKVKVSTPGGLNIRSQPKKDSKCLGAFCNGAKTEILEEKNGWGRIGTGKWICLKYTKKI